jgi:flagellar protein FliO/FliZ
LLSRFGIETSPAVQYLIAFMIIFVLLAIFALVLRRITGGKLKLAGQERGRTRQPRLGIVDIYDLDRQRQLVLLRRDNVEHLLLIGGPNDVMVETNIVRMAGGRLPNSAPDSAIERIPANDPPTLPERGSERSAPDASRSTNLAEAALSQRGSSDPVIFTRAEPARTEPARAPEPARATEFVSAPLRQRVEKAPQPEVQQPKAPQPKAPPPVFNAPTEKTAPAQASQPALSPAIAPPIAPSPPPASVLKNMALAEEIKVAAKAPPAVPQESAQQEFIEEPVVTVPAPLEEPQPVRAKASQPVDAAVLSDMAKQLEEALKRPMNAPKAAAVSEALTPPPAPSAPPVPSAPPAEERIEVPDPRAPEPANIAPAPSPKPSKVDNRPVIATQPQRPAQVEKTVQAAPVASPIAPKASAPSPAPASQADNKADDSDPFSLEEIEAQFAMLLGRGPNAKEP